MVSVEILEFWIFVFGIFTAIIVIVVGLWRIDKGRQETPFYALGFAMSKAWAAKQAERLSAGEISALPQTVSGLEKMADEALRTSGWDPTKMGEQATDISLRQERDQLKKEKEALERRLEEHGIPATSK